jgi:hypothetical protein
MKKMFFNIFSESFLKEKSESRSMPNGSGRCKTKKERKSLVFQQHHVLLARRSSSSSRSIGKKVRGFPPSVAKDHHPYKAFFFYI